MFEAFDLRVNCPPDFVTIEQVDEAVKTFKKLLGCAKASNWRISNLGIHSISMAATPTIDDEKTAESSEILHDLATLPSHEDDIRKLEIYANELASIDNLMQHTGADISISMGSTGGLFTPSFMTRVNGVLAHGVRNTFGHARGTVDKVILQRNKRILGMVDDVRGERFDISFGKDMDTVVQKIQVGMTIDARGLIQRDNKPAKMRAEDINVIQEEHHIPVTAADLMGIAPFDFTGGLGSVGYVSALRGSYEDLEDTE